MSVDQVLRDLAGSQVLLAVVLGAYCFCWAVLLAELLPRREAAHVER